jgi:hypothetical protein
MKLTNQTWQSWASTIAQPANIMDYDAPAMKRFMTVMEDYIVSVKGVRPKYPARNRVKKIPFKTKEQQKQYDLTWEKYQRELELLRGAPKEFGHFQQLVAMMKFGQAAELIRHEELGDNGHEAITQRGKHAVIAVKHKETIAAVVKYMCKTYGYTRDDFSIIWGGMGGKFSADGKVKLREKQIPRSVFDALSANDKELLKSLNVRLILMDGDKRVGEVELSQELDDRKKLEDAGFRSVGSDDIQNLRLGGQSAKARNEEIKRFQTGITKICLFTFKAGGVGLSLHHCHENAKPRETFLAPCYSAIELVQGLGRAPRLTSMSETIQTMLFYKGTIEEHIADRVSEKLKCLQEVVRQRESWEDVIVNPPKDTVHSEDVKEILDESQDVEIDEEDDENE